MDDVAAISFFTKLWPLFGFIPVVLKFGWRDIKNEFDFTERINKIIVKVDRLSQDGKVSIVGCSAGGNIAINVFFKRADAIQKVVNICGALKFAGTSSKFDTPIYINSLKICEKILSEMDGKSKERIMTIRPQFGDEFIKKETVIIEGAKNTTIPTGEHMFSILMALTLFSKKIFDFFKK